MNENDVLFQKVTQAYSEKYPSAPIRSRTYDLPITSSDALPLSYRRLVGAKAIKLIGALGFFFPSMPVSLSGIIHHSQHF